ncbi:MAG: DUF3168 domain-containing protein [Synergistaceae bacterium]|jgi:hypothetical protein|nr:DUF3168 domain-containing protein [Synergistaceae bacterium]
MTLSALYEDIYRRLTEYEPLSHLLAGEKVYDFAPDKEAPSPYVVIGDTQEVEGRTMDDTERKVFVRLHIWSAYSGRKEVIGIEREIEAALEGDQYLFESSLILLDESDWMHGVVVFRTYIERDDD